MYIMGISCFFHEAAACIVKDGQLIAAAAEERFTREKHTPDFPINAIRYCLDEAGIIADDLDYVGFYEKPLQKFDRILISSIAAWPKTYRMFVKAVPVWLKKKVHMSRIISDTLNMKPDVNFLFCRHHLAHAASAFLVSPFEKAAILTADGVGEWATTAYGVGEGNNIYLDKTIGFPHSLGLLYSALTSYLGFRVNDAEWKVMGLAPYGKPSFVTHFRKVVDIKDDGSFRLNMKYFAHHYSDEWMFNHRWERLFGQSRRKPESDLTDFHQDIAHSGQKIVEEILVKIARHLYKTYRTENLCIAGGVGLNSVGNSKILQETAFENIFIQPAAGDDGGALGTAFYIYNCLLEKKRGFVMKHAYYGPGYSNEQFEMFLKNKSISGKYYDTDSLLTKTARLIEQDKVVGWFQGRMEFGPRALGARSILANARNPQMKEIVNSKVKFRERFRPFAPSVLREKAHLYFDLSEGFDSPFMLLVPAVLAEKRHVVPAVTHHDGTGRVQTLTREENGLFFELVKRFDELTGVPVVLNTSFNIAGEPIVCTPEDAYNCFCNSGIDVLVLGNYVISKKPHVLDQGLLKEESISSKQEALSAKCVC